MDEFTLIENYFKKLTYKNPSALNLNDDVFFDKKNNVVISIDTYVEGIHFLNLDGNSFKSFRSNSNNFINFGFAMGNR